MATLRRSARSSTSVLPEGADHPTGADPQPLLLCAGGTAMWWWLRTDRERFSAPGPTPVGAAGAQKRRGTKTEVAPAPDPPKRAGSRGHQSAEDPPSDRAEGLPSFRSPTSPVGAEALAGDARCRPPHRSVVTASRSFVRGSPLTTWRAARPEWFSPLVPGGRCLTRPPALGVLVRFRRVSVGRSLRSSPGHAPLRSVAVSATLDPRRNVVKG